MADEPAYLRIARELRQRIVSGELGPGAKLPSVLGLARQYGVSDGVPRDVYNLLRAEGLVDARLKSGYYVRVPPPVRRVALNRYRLEADHQPGDQPSTSFTADQGITWGQYQLDKRFEETVADNHLADLFGVPIGTPILIRHFVFRAAGRPAQMSRSCLLLSDVRGTPVADPAGEPWPGGTIAQMASLGLPVVRVDESVRTRMPAPEESATLQIAPGIPVLTITRRMHAADRVVEVAADIIMPGDSVVLDYSIDL